jgi:acyl-CoA synthetase (AMP-forming)/AMP-acid ligase II
VKAPSPDPRPLDHLTLGGEPEAVALITREGVLDFAGLERSVGTLAAALKARGLGAGERVASWLPKNRMTSLLPLACARAGLVHVPVNPLLKRGQVAHILSDSGARLFITGAARLATLGTGDLPEGCAVVEEEEGAQLLEISDVMPPSAAAPDDLAALLYTSGSTGRPKGVMLSHANLWLGAVSVAHYLRLTPDDRTLGVLPLSFDYGQNQLLSSWAAGASVIPIEYLSARDVIRAIERHGITTLAGVPPLWVQLIEAAWPPQALLMLRRLTNSGGRLPTSVVRRMRELFPLAEIYLMYGLTEAFRPISIRRCWTSIPTPSAAPSPSPRSWSRGGTAPSPLRAKRASSSMPDRSSPKAIGTIPHAPPSASAPRRKAPHMAAPPSGPGTRCGATSRGSSISSAGRTR